MYIEALTNTNAKSRLNLEQVARKRVKHLLNSEQVLCRDVKHLLNSEQVPCSDVKSLLNLEKTLFMSVSLLLSVETPFFVRFLSFHHYKMFNNHFINFNFLRTMFIKKIHYVELQNEEHAGFHAYVDDYISETGAAILKVETQSTDHKMKLAVEKSVLDLVLKNTFTVRVNAADEVRDKPIRGFFKVVKGLLHHFNPAVAQAAYNIDVINEKFSNLTRLSKEKQTPAEESYISALKAAIADINMLGLNDWLMEIEATENAFVQMVKNRNNEDDLKPALNMRAARQETDDACEAIIDRINAFITIEGDALYATFVTKINNRIDQYNNTIAQRKGIAAAKKKDDATAEEAK